jgi:hypothetical protein
VGHSAEGVVSEGKGLLVAVKGVPRASHRADDATDAVPGDVPRRMSFSYLIVDMSRPCQKDSETLPSNDGPTLMVPRCPRDMDAEWLWVDGHLARRASKNEPDSRGGRPCLSSRNQEARGTVSELRWTADGRRRCRGPQHSLKQRLNGLVLAILEKAPTRPGKKGSNGTERYVDEGTAESTGEDHQMGCVVVLVWSLPKPKENEEKASSLRSNSPSPSADI